MSDDKDIYVYLAALKEKPGSGDFAAYQERIKAAEIAFRANVTQLVMDKGQDARLILVYQDYMDLLDGLRYYQSLPKKEKEWLDYEVTKTEEALAYMERVQRVITEGTTISSNPGVNNKTDKNEAEGILVISGTQGLADFLGCGKTKAFAIIKSGILKRAGIQYQVGKCWKFHAVKLRQFLAETPEILK